MSRSNGLWRCCSKRNSWQDLKWLYCSSIISNTFSYKRLAGSLFISLVVKIKVYIQLLGEAWIRQIPDVVRSQTWSPRHGMTSRRSSDCVSPKPATDVLPRKKQSSTPTQDPGVCARELRKSTMTNKSAQVESTWLIKRKKRKKGEFIGFFALVKVILLSLKCKAASVWGFWSIYLNKNKEMWEEALTCWTFGRACDALILWRISVWHQMKNFSAWTWSRNIFKPKV